MTSSISGEVKSLKTGFFVQLKATVSRNFLLKRRKKFALARELLLPAFYLLLVVALKASVTYASNLVTGSQPEVLQEYSDPPGPIPAAFNSSIINILEEVDVELLKRYNTMDVVLKAPLTNSPLFQHNLCGSK